MRRQLENLRSRLWLCLPVVTMGAIDASVTLYGQPASYWQGDYTSCNEANGPLALALSLRPAMFVVAISLELLLLCLIILLCRPRIAQIVTLWSVFAISACVFDWLRFCLLLPLPLAISMLLFPASLAWFAINKSSTARV